MEFKNHKFSNTTGRKPKQDNYNKNKANRKK